MRSQTVPDYETLGDAELCDLVGMRNPGAVRVLTMRNNQRLFRAAWSILKSRSDAEDAVQSAYLKAFQAIHRFEGRSSLSTWLTRIVINEALARKRTAKRRKAMLEKVAVPVLDDYRDNFMRGSAAPAPDEEVMRSQLRVILERAISGLPECFRPVFVLREIEGLSVEETAEALGLVPGTVKTRLLRARRRLQQALAPDMRIALEESFPFAGADCSKLTERVIEAFCASPQ